MSEFTQHIIKLFLTVGTVAVCSACTPCTTRYRHESLTVSPLRTPVKAITLTLSDYAQCAAGEGELCSETQRDGAPWRRGESENKRDEIFSQVKNGILSFNRDIHIDMPAAVNRNSRLAVNASTSNIQADPGSSYDIRISVYSRSKESPISFDEGALLFAIPVWSNKKITSKNSVCSAEIIETVSSRTIEQISVYSDGKSTITFPFLLIIPLPPIPTTAYTEETACTRLGELVGKRLLGLSLNSIPAIELRR